MKGTKQSRADHQAKQIAALVNVVNHLMQEVDHLRNLSVGTLETIKCMPDYEEALAKLQNKVKENKDDVS
jgi:hypothetical protein